DQPGGITLGSMLPRRVLPRRALAGRALPRHARTRRTLTGAVEGEPDTVGEIGGQGGHVTRQPVLPAVADDHRPRCMAGLPEPETPGGVGGEVRPTGPSPVALRPP